MSKEQAKGFFEALSKDKQLAEEVKEVLGGQATNSEKASELFGLAKVHGFDFTKSEASSLTKDELKASLKIESLSDVSGGAKGSIKPAVMAAFLLTGMGLSGVAMSNMEASAAPTNVQAEQRVDSYDVYTAEDFVNFFTREDYQGQATRGVTITLRSDISLTAAQAFAVMDATGGRAVFGGTLDGRGHSITLDYTEVQGDGILYGLFDRVEDATFRNVRIVDHGANLRRVGVLTNEAVNTTFENVDVIIDNITLELPSHMDLDLGMGLLACKCSGNCRLTNCVGRVGAVTVQDQHGAGFSGTLCFGGLVGRCEGLEARSCAFSGNIDVSSTTAAAVYVGGIVGGEPSLSGSIKVDNCVVSNSQINAQAKKECSAGAIAACCRANSIVRNSAVLNCNVEGENSYAGQIVGSEHGATDSLIYGCFHTNEGPAVGREREQNPNAAVQADQDTIMSALPNLAPVLERLQNQQEQQEQQEQQTGLVSSALKWVGSWFGLGGNK